MSDYTKVRTAYDLEQKYNLREVSGEVKRNTDEIVKTNTTLNEFVSETLDEFEDVQTQLDGKVETYYYNGSPSFSNPPTSTWAVADYPKHIGDMYYDRTTGYTYRFTNTGLTGWDRIKDEDITEAYSLAGTARDTADNKRRIFLTSEDYPHPTPPYDEGDLWVQDDQSDIYVCQGGKAEGDSYDQYDWIKASKYTDDTYAMDLTDELEGTYSPSLQGRVLDIMAKYVKFTSLSDPNSTTEIDGGHITTGTIKSKNYEDQGGVITGTSFDLINGEIKSKGFSIDSSGNASLATGLVNIGGTGISISSNESYINSTLDNKSWSIKDNGDHILLEMKYDTVTNSAVGTVDNFTVTSYFTSGSHRVESFEDSNNKKRTGWFYVGG